MLDYTHKYYPHLKYRSKEGIFTVDNEDEMKYLLWGIEQRYYMTPVTKENRVANSVSRLDVKNVFYYLHCDEGRSRELCLNSLYYTSMISFT